jgi:hypothetical protein
VTHNLDARGGTWRNLLSGFRTLQNIQFSAPWFAPGKY